MKKFLRKIIHFFLEGLLIIVPFGVTVFLVVWTLNWTKEKIQVFFNFIINYLPYFSTINSIPYLNVFVVFAFIAFLGYIASNFLVKSILGILEELIMGIPIMNIIYSYIKDSTTAFIEKFDKPVLVTINKALDIKKIGFITQETLESLPLQEGKVAVYIPHSYSFSGELMLIDKKHLAYLGISTTDALRLILSGGLSNLEVPQKSFIEIGKKINTHLVEERQNHAPLNTKKKKSNYT